MASGEQIKLVVPCDFPPHIQGSPHLARLKPYGELALYADRPSGIEEQLDRVKSTHVILNTQVSVKWFRDELEQLPGLRMISTCSIGTDNIDLAAARELGIVVSNQPGRVSPYVAEHVIGLLFALAKRAAYQTAEMKAGRWAMMENVFLKGKTLGVIGTGNTGAEVARLGNALGMRVIAWTFNPSPRRATALGVEFVGLDDLLRWSDAVTIQVRLSDDSRRMISSRELGLMKPGALLINGGRGELVDTAALVDALNSGRLGGAGLDVFDQEPLPPDHPILSCEQVVLTPHIADQTPEGIESLNEGVVSNVIAFLEGRPQNVAT
jgi:D-3-phosphoglycerate dehydrogenase